MRSILHHPEFQALEAAWRSVHFLVKRLETDPSLGIKVLDLTRVEFEEDLDSDKLEGSAIYKLVVDKTVGTPGGERWSVIVGNYTFDNSDASLALLSRVGEVARRAGALFIGAGHPRIVGCESLAETPDPDDWSPPADAAPSETWTSLIGAQAAHVALAIPRFLLRLPYGTATNETESFDFEEVQQTPGHEDYLWSNPAFVCACLLGQSFSKFGWAMRPESINELSGLPIHVYADQGESRVTPCTEVLLSERAIERIAASGLIALSSHRGRDLIRVPGWRSLAGPLAGPWSSARI
jgi:type VI secretion system protein ImpC